jgi:hypothetical protein
MRKQKRTPVLVVSFFGLYEDDTNDTTDDLTLSVVVTQGKNYILDISQDFGPNTYGAGLIHFSGDVAFGTIGNHTGPGNGWCFVDTVTCSNPTRVLRMLLLQRPSVAIQQRKSSRLNFSRPHEATAAALRSGAAAANHLNMTPGLKGLEFGRSH